MIALPTFRGVLAGGFDPDAADYFARIVADGSSITTANKFAVNAFVKGCKTDGIWSAIKACCLLAGPDDLTGALVPLVGAAPTNNNFVSGDHNRTTGLVGDGSTKYLNSNRNNNADPQNSFHLCVYVTKAQANTTAMALIGAGGTSSGASGINNGVDVISARNRNGSLVAIGASLPVAGFLGTNRSISTEYLIRSNAGNNSRATSSETPFNGNIFIFSRDGTASSDGRISFYSIGESLDLALLDARLTTYMAALT
jgi:hypothetical protein